MVLRKILSHKIALIINLGLIIGLFFWLRNELRLLHNVQFILGWSLFALAAFMGIYKLRKKLSVLPLGSNRLWYLLHLYGGFWCIILFSLHSGWNWPSGIFNQTLWLGSILILLSGILGLLLTKLLTPLISSQGERLIFDRIPGHISLNREQSQLLILEAAATKAGKPLADYFNYKLLNFFNHSGQLGFKLFIHKKNLEKHLMGLDEICRYLDEENKLRLNQLKEFVKKKSMLDWQYSLLSILRSWTLLHVPIIWSVFIILIVHIIIQYAFMVPVPW